MSCIYFRKMEYYMKHLAVYFLTLFALLPDTFAQTSVSPILYFMRSPSAKRTFKTTVTRSPNTADVTLRFSEPPDDTLLHTLESHGVTFKKSNTDYLHTRHIYCAVIDLDSLDVVASIPEVLHIESTFRPVTASTLEVSNPQVQAEKTWSIPATNGFLDGTGVVIANFDTGVDVYHPGFFKPDGGTYEWLDFNRSGSFEPGVDFVDLNNDGQPSVNEYLNFFDAYCSDPLSLIDRKTGLYDADLDWLFNDANNNGTRDYGISSGYTESSPSYGELLFVISDDNKNRRLDPGEKLTALGTSKILGIVDKNGTHRRGVDLLQTLGDTGNHGTGSTGILGGNIPGRRFVGMAPCAEFVVIDRSDIEIEKAVIQAKQFNPAIMQYEFASWVYEFLDGSSNLETLISDLYDEGIHQFTASGNLAGPTRKKHARISIPRSDKQTLDFTVPEIGVHTVYLSILWKNTTLSPSIQLKFPDSSVVLISGDKNERQHGSLTYNSGLEISTKKTNRMDIYISSSNSITGEFSIILTNRRTTSITIDSYIADDQTQWMNGTQFQNDVTDDGTVCSPGTAENTITVGAYDPRGTRNTLGDINDFSSWGMTIDGRRAVDITAPGTLVYSLISHDAVGYQPGGYIDFGGTSAALPHVTGCAALIVQAFPGITPDNLGDVLFKGCLTDSFTGVTPNDVWGYGKLRIYDSLYSSGIVTLVNEIKPAAFSVSNSYPNPFNGATSFDIFIPRKNHTNNTQLIVTVYSILGQKLDTITYQLYDAESFHFTWNTTMYAEKQLSSGLLLFTFSFDSMHITKTAVFLK